MKNEGSLPSIIENPADAGEPPILIKINTAGSTDYYLTYNRRELFNSQTEERGNQVMVVSAGEGSGYAESELLAKLSTGATFSVSDIEISVVEISGGRANIKICIANGCETASRTTSLTAVPTKAPTASPTKVPTTSLTDAPTKELTTSPPRCPPQLARLPSPPRRPQLVLQLAPPRHPQPVTQIAPPRNPPQVARLPPQPRRP